MDGTAAIASNLQALRRILAGLFAMAGFSRGGAGSASPSDQEKSPCEGDKDARRPDARRLPRKGEVFLPRHLRLAILRLLRPAESAARRLIIASARGLTVTLPPPRDRKPKPVTAEPFLRRFGIAVVLPAGASILPRSRGVSSRFAEGKSIVPVGRWKAGERRDAAQQRGPRRQGTGEAGGGGGPGASHPHPEAATSGVSRRTALPLFDPPRRVRLTAGRRTVPAHAAPRISFPGVTAAARPETQAAAVSQKTPDDPIDASRLAQRLAALAAALEDLPAQARRFARLRALRARAKRPRRISPLRPGRPPGGRLARFDPSAKRDAAGAQTRTAPRRIREIDEILAHAHALALYALENPDTS